MKNISRLLLFFTLSLLLFNCKKPKDNIAEISEIDEFIWKGLSDYYYWEDVAPFISDASYESEAHRNNFINSFNGNHEYLFYSLLYEYGQIDRWSWIVDDYVALENALQGIAKTKGFEYGLVYKDQSQYEIYGYVKYIMPGSPADIAGLKRGDLFLEIDDTPLNTQNYKELLSKSSYKLSLASFVNNTLLTNGISYTLTEVEFQENPILMSKIFDLNGIKTGYLVYNGFVSSYDNALNVVFQNFIDQGVTELILDLRYNGGGSVRSAAYLSSMIYGTNTDEIFSTSQYNAALQDYFTQEYGDDFFNNYFAETIAQSDGGSIPIHSLNLPRVHIIATRNSASASELVINGLRPYMDVVLIGSNTHGKYVGSFTIKDYIAQDVVNPNHTWAMQPITFKIFNAQGVSDYVNGLTPTIEVEEDVNNLIAFGEVSEPLLNVALNNITGKAPDSNQIFIFNHRQFLDSKDLKLLGKDMYIDIDLKP
ncbi:MAG: peptidase S41 [Flavobacteriia bacterium]|nr:MAG: peptidase S41 [Flavobacteriia bacterium]